MASVSMVFKVTNYMERPSIPNDFENFRTRFSSVFKLLLKDLQQNSMQISVHNFIKNSSVKLLDALVDSVFEFSDQPVMPGQSNIAPVDEFGQAVVITDIEGKIPDDFRQGVYIRNGPNPLFGGLKSTKSIFGSTSHTWIEGEGMLHAMYFGKKADGNWTIVYNNKHVETDTFKLEKRRNKPAFLPAIEGDSPAILFAYLLNLLRFGEVNKFLSNTNVFEHAGKCYSIAENHKPQEIDIFTLATLRNWDVNGAWNRPFTSHPKKAPETGELVIMGVEATKPYVEVGVISADGKELIHKVDLRLDRCTLSHELGVTQRYTIFLDFPLSIDIERLIKGGPLIKYNKQEYARIGVIPRYGDADSIRWFEVESNCTFHILNCFEDGDEVVVMGCTAQESIIPGPEKGLNKHEWFSRKLRPMPSDEEDIHDMAEDAALFHRGYEWRLNMRTGDVKERYLTGKDYSMDFPMINENFTGIKNKYGYTQVIDSVASSSSGMPKYGGLAKLYLEETAESSTVSGTEQIQVEYHKFGKNIFCTGAAFVAKEQGLEEDDGWIVTIIHNEESNISQVYIVDAKKFSDEPVAKITLPCRVPYGFHGVFLPVSF